MQTSPGSKPDPVTKKSKELLHPTSADYEIRTRILSELIILKTVSQGILINCNIHKLHFFVIKKLNKGDKEVFVIRYLKERNLVTRIIIISL